MGDDPTQSRWIERLREAPDTGAVHKLWEEYFDRLVRLARVKLRDASRRTADEEDVALSAIQSFCRNAGRGRFPGLRDRDDLWRLLVTITARKASDHRRREGRIKRGGGGVRGHSAVIGAEGEGGWDEIAGDGPSPELIATSTEEYARLLDLLPDDELREIAVSKMEGLTNEEIAAKVGRAVPTVERRLRLVRKAWAAELDGGDSEAPGPAR